jgi:hypothetical protein
VARPEVTGRRPFGDEEADASSIKTFCRRHGISIATYYNLRANGLAPREATVRGRRLITKEAAAVWRRERERDAVPA